MMWRRPRLPLRYPGTRAQRAAIRDRRPAHIRAIRALIARAKQTDDRRLIVELYLMLLHT